jgi:hypothetical protein
MVEYFVDVAMPLFTVTRNRRTEHPDDVYLYWNVQLRKTGYGIDGKVHPAIDVSTARLHIPGIPLLAVDSMAPDLRNIRESFFDNPNNPFKEPLKVRVKARSDQAIIIHYVAQSIINERADPAARSRAFNNTINDVDAAVNVAIAGVSMAGGGAYAGPIGAVIKMGLGVAKGINNYLDPPDAPQVDCSGPLATGSVVMEVEKLVAILGTNPEVTHTMDEESYQETPQACSAHGALSRAHFSFTIKPAPEFLPEDHDSANWKVSPVTGLPLSAWQGTWGETPSITSNKIHCSIDFHPAMPPIVFPSLSVEVREKLGPRNYSVNFTQRVFRDDPAFIDTVPAGDGRMLRRRADSIRLHDGVTLYLYSARDQHNQWREHRIRYRRRNDAGVLEADKMLVRAYGVT